MGYIDRGVNFFRRVGGMMLPNWRDYNSRTSHGGRARVLGNSFDKLQNTPWAICAKSVCLKYVTRVLYWKGLGGLSVVLSGVHNISWQKYSHTVKFKKIELILQILYLTEKKKKYFFNVLLSKWFKFQLEEFLHKKVGDNIDHPLPAWKVGGIYSPHPRLNRHPWSSRVIRVLTISA